MLLLCFLGEEEGGGGVVDVVGVGGGVAVQFFCLQRCRCGGSGDGVRRGVSMV